MPGEKAGVGLLRTVRSETRLEPVSDGGFSTAGAVDVLNGRPSKPRGTRSAGVTEMSAHAMGVRALPERFHSVSRSRRCRCSQRRGVAGGKGAPPRTHASRKTASRERRFDTQTGKQISYFNSFPEGVEKLLK